jgi:predicted short-subunit dehydrogenase-like oxidoreductase (DUF2520 family)
MRQVPRNVSYLLIGNGRVARHFQHYFSLLQLPFATWHRLESLPLLREQIRSASHILLLISDDGVDPFIDAHLSKSSAVLIHCSGSLNSRKAYGAHPLMTFGSAIYADDIYASLPFMIDDHALAFADLLPGLPNAHFRLDRRNKAKYHALCVLAGNFSCLLWQKLLGDFEQDLGWPAASAAPYLKQQMQNLLSDYRNALTGPLVRGDSLTLQRNLDALKNDPFQAVYHSFISCYRSITEAP